MGAAMLSTNAAAVADRLRAYRMVIDGWIAELDRLVAAKADQHGAKKSGATETGAVFAEERPSASTTGSLYQRVVKAPAHRVPASVMAGAHSLRSTTRLR